MQKHFRRFSNYNDRYVHIFSTTCFTFNNKLSMFFTVINSKSIFSSSEMRIPVPILYINDNCVQKRAVHFNFYGNY